jgi:hypothetical protein
MSKAIWGAVSLPPRGAGGGWGSGSRRRAMERYFAAVPFASS